MFPKVTKLAVIPGGFNQHDTLEFRFGHVSFQTQIASEDLDGFGKALAIRLLKTHH
jgi:hypothetical protein